MYKLFEVFYIDEYDESFSKMIMARNVDHLKQLIKDEITINGKITMIDEYYIPVEGEFSDPLMYDVHDKRTKDNFCLIINEME